MDGEVKKENRKPKNKALKIAASVLLVFAVSLLIIFTAAQKLGNVTVTAMASDVKAYFLSVGAGDGYPCAVDGNKIKNISINNSNLLILTEDKTTVLTPTAKEIMPQEHSYSNPVMKTKGSKAIVYDLDSGRFRIQSGTEILSEHELERQITAAAIGKKGNYAVACYGESVQSVLTVYGRNKREVFVWKFKDERVSDIALSDDGKYAAVCAVRVADGDVCSRLYVFNFKSEKPAATFDYEGTALVRADYVKGNDITAVGDNMRSYIKNNSKRQDDGGFGSDFLHNYCVNDKGRSAVVLSKYGSSALSELSVYTGSNKKQFTVSFDREIKWVDCGSKYTAVLFKNEVQTFNKKGEQTGSVTFNGEPLRVAVDGNKIYLLTTVSLYCCDAKGTTQLQSEK